MSSSCAIGQIGRRWPRSRGLCRLVVRPAGLDGGGHGRGGLCRPVVRPAGLDGGGHGRGGLCRPVVRPPGWTAVATCRVVCVVQLCDRSDWTAVATVSGVCVVQLCDRRGGRRWPRAGWFVSSSCAPGRGGRRWSMTGLARSAEVSGVSAALERDIHVFRHAGHLAVDNFDLFEVQREAFGRNLAVAGGGWCSVEVFHAWIFVGISTANCRRADQWCVACATTN